MDLVLSPAATVNFHILLETTEAGRTVAAIAELANCRVEADTRGEALDAIRVLVRDRLNKIEVLPLEISSIEQTPSNPWTEFIGMFEDDPEFSAIAADFQAKREQELDDLT